MADRKETPDVLGDILGGSASTPAPAPSGAAARSEPSSPPTSAPKPKATRKRRSSPARQPKWEYMEIVFRDYRGWRPRFINGAELSDWRNEAVIHQYLDQLGAEGWEMVDIEKRRWYEKVAYFKRQSK